MAFVANDSIAYILAIDYNFLPPVKCHATGGSQIVKGKYETVGDIYGERTMLLAHWYDHTNILIKFDPLAMYSPGSPTLPVSYNVTGELEPDASGDYHREPCFNDKPTHFGPERKFFSWWDGVDSWIINDQIGHTDGPFWKRTNPIITGEYAPQAGAVGIAIVSAGPG